MSLPLNPFTSSPIPSMNILLSSEKRDNQMQVENVDRISELPDHVLLKILKSMSTEKAVQTSVLSKRWEGVWKQLPFLCFDMRNTLKLEEPPAQHSKLISQLITKVINNHSGHLELCEILHFPYQTRDGKLENWIRSLIHVKHTRYLALMNIRVNRRQATGVLHLPPNIFSHPTLTSLLLFRYKLEFAHAFNNCNNLIVLRLHKIRVEVSVFNTVIASCPSLKVLVLDILWYSPIGCLKIHNDNLKLLHVACTDIGCIEVSAALLDILSVHYTSEIKVVLATPRLLKFSKRCWDEDQNMPHIIYNISCDAQGNENIGHKFVVNKNNYYLIMFASLAVNVDMINPKEVYVLKELLDAWGRHVQKLEIFFKHNNVSKEEGESSIDGIQKKWEYFFLSVDLRVKDVWMYNFSGLNKEEVALASSFVIQGTMMKKLMINTSSIPANKKLEADVAVAKLMELPKGNKELSIECF